MTLIPTVDPDLWWHLKTGQVILTQGIPKVDIFSFTMRGSPWITHEWLSEVFLYLIFKMGGLSTLMIFFALMGVAIFSCVYSLCGNRVWISFSFAFFACWIAKFMWGSRPQLFNVLMLAILMWLFENVRIKKISWKWLYGIPFLMLLWVNLHSGFLLGMVVMLVWGVGDTLQIFIRKNEEGTLGKEVLQHLVIVWMLSAIAVFVNPSGIRIWFYAFPTLTSPMMREGILEWLSPNFHHEFYVPFLIGMIIGSLVFMISPSKRTFSEMFFYGGVVAAGLISRRHIPFFAVVAIPIMARALADYFETSSLKRFFMEKVFPQKIKIGLFWVGIVTSLVFLTNAGIFSWKKIQGNDAAVRQMYPVEAVRFLKEAGLSEKHGYNDYGFGGYLIWSDIPVFIDGRADMYGDDFFRQYAKISELKSNWKEIYLIFSRFDIQYVLVASNSLVAGVFRTNEDWKEAFRDNTASLFVLQRVPMRPLGGLSKTSP